MYPTEELNRLAVRKRALQGDIARCRRQCTEAAHRAVQPLEWIDRMLAFWRRLSPLAKLAAVPLGLLVKRRIFPRMKLLGFVFRWAPMIFTAIRGIRSVAQARAASTGR